ncbi:MAG: hypothetical protein WA918_11740 [Erythrobacter sp.]
MDITYIPIILALVTLGAVFLFAVTRAKKASDSIPDDADPHPEEKLATKQERPTYEPTQQSAASEGTEPPTPS